MFYVYVKEDQIICASQEKQEMLNSTEFVVDRPGNYVFKDGELKLLMKHEEVLENPDYFSVGEVNEDLYKQLDEQHKTTYKEKMISFYTTQIEKATDPKHKTYYRNLLKSFQK